MIKRAAVLLWDYTATSLVILYAVIFIITQVFSGWTVFWIGMPLILGTMVLALYGGYLDHKMIKEWEKSIYGD